MKKLGFGLMRLPLIDGDYFNVDISETDVLIREFINAGFSYFDVAYNYHGDLSENVFRLCVSEKYPRDKYIIADKMPMWEITTNSDYERIFDEQKKRCGVDYFDVYLLHGLGASSYETAVRTGGFEFLSKLHQNKEAVATGFSFHGDAELLERILSEQNNIDVVQLQINYLDWNDDAIESRKCYEVCVKHRKKIIVMEGLKGGTLATLPSHIGKLLSDYNPYATHASWGYRFVASLPDVEVVLSGMNEMSQMADNIRTFNTFLPITDAEKGVLQQVVEEVRKTNQIKCTGCNYCSICPRGIPIPKYIALYNNLKKNGVNGSDLLTYQNYSEQFPIDLCIDCMKCCEICPQHIAVPRELRKITATFTKHF